MTNNITDSGSGTQTHAPQVDLDAYFARIGYQGPRDATLETLRAIHLLHPQAIPFENLDPLMHRPVPLDLDSLQQKLVLGFRGGGCALLPVSNEFEWEEALVEPLMAILLPGHSLAGSSSVDLVSSQSTPLIPFDQSSSLHRIVIEATHRRGFEPS